MLYLISSAALFALPYTFADWYWLLFFSLIPLMYRSYYRGYSFADGFLWGVIVFAIHTMWFLQSILSRGAGYKSFFFWALIVVWFSLFSGSWLWLQSFIQKNMQGDCGFILSWIVTTILFFYCVIDGSLLCCGAWEGYVFFNPMIILAQRPEMLWSIWYLKDYGMLLCLTLVQIGFVLTVLRFCWYGGLVFFAILPFGLGFLFYSPQALPPMPICFLKPWWHESRDPMFVGYRMIHAVTLLQYERPDVKCIVMPESSFGWDMYAYPQFISMLGDDCSDAKILFGGQRKVENSIRSSFFTIQNGRIVFIYDKIHLMPFVERSCHVCGLSLFQRLLNHEQFFTYGLKDQDDIVEMHGTRFQLFICSELFFEAKPTRDMPVLFVCNDAWFDSDYAKKWVPLFVRYFSIKYDISIVWATVCGQTNII